VSQLSWIQSARSPETIKIRDDGQEAYEGTKDDAGKLVTDEDGSFTDPPRPYRPAWPEGHYVIIKAHITAGDQARAKRMSWLDEEGGTVSDPTMRFKFWETDIVTSAVMIVGLEGTPFPHPDGPDPETGNERWITPTYEDGKPWKAGFFTDPDTGEALVFEGSDLDRLTTAKRLPGEITKFVDTYCEDRLQDPLGLKALSNGTGVHSTPTSTPPSKTSRKSGKTGAAAASRN
jgi:hypothetical protein